MAVDTEVEQLDTEDDSNDEQLLDGEGDELEADEAEGEGTEADDSGDEPGEEQQQDEAADEVSIGFDDDPTPEGDRSTETPVIRTLRSENKQLVRRVRDLEAKLKAPPEAPQADEQIEAKPTLADCEFDEEVFAEKLVKWNAKKASIEAKRQEREQQQQKATEAYQAKRQAYQAAAASLGVKDFEDAEAHAKDIFSNVQQSILVKHATNPAALVYALGNTEAGRKRAKELAAIADPIEFALAAAKLEEKHLKVTTRKTAPPPERQLKGNGSTTAATAARLDALRKKAQQTGDYTAYLAAKRQKDSATR